MRGVGIETDDGTDVTTDGTEARATVGVEELRTLFLFEKLPESKLEWLSEHGERAAYDAGAVVFAQNAPSEFLYVLLEGTMHMTKSVGGQEVSISTTDHRGAYAGAMRAFVHEDDQVYQNSVRAVEPCSFFRLPAPVFSTFMHVHMPMAVHLLDGLYLGIRNAEATVRQREHLAQLGTLSASLAHELNNPAASAVRSAAQLERTLATLATASAEFARATPEFAAAAEELRSGAVDRSRNSPSSLGALDRADAEDELGDLLEDSGVEHAQEIAVVFVAAGLDADWVEDALSALDGPARSSAFSWLSAALEADALSREIGVATGAISTLVAAVKEYSYMDSSSVQEIDVHAGIVSTLTMLGHALRDVDVRREFAPDLPRIAAYGAELNQVWTNLIDNAAAALGGRGTITVRTSLLGQGAGACVRVEVVDDGPGIPEDVQHRVFEAYFTTKGPGSGTGLGLDTCRRIVEDRHHGHIGLTSGPGGTTFTVDIPVSQRLP